MKTTIQTENGTPPSPQPVSAMPVRKRPWSPLVWGGLALVVVAIAAVLFVRLRAGKALTYVTAPVVRTTLVQTVTAEGTVNPQNLILVGTQVSGTISELDVDYNSAVRVGQVMAKSIRRHSGMRSMPPPRPHAIWQPICSRRRLRAKRRAERGDR